MPADSFLIGILHLIKLILLCDDSNKRGRPYVYPTTVILRCYVVRIWFRIPSNNALHYWLSLNTATNRKIIQSCGLHSLPDRRTFDRRFKTVPIRDMIIALGGRFVAGGFADMSVVAADSTTIYAMNRRVWHRSSIKKGKVPYHGIDTDARWGFARTRGWVFGYKLHMSCSTGKMAVPLSADFTTANVYDNQAYHSLIEPLQNVQYVVADAGYDDQKLYDYTRQKGIRLICPIRRYRRTKGERLKLIEFYKSRKGQRIYRNRSISIEPLFQCVKDAFGISVAPVRGFESVQSYVMMCVFVYQIATYYNCVMNHANPRCIKRMLGN